MQVYAQLWTIMCERSSLYLAASVKFYGIHLPWSIQ